MLIAIIICTTILALTIVICYTTYKLRNYQEFRDATSTIKYKLKALDDDLCYYIKTINDIQDSVNEIKLNLNGDEKYSTNS